MLYALPEKPAENTQGKKDNRKLFRRKINLIL